MLKNVHANIVPSLAKGNKTPSNNTITALQPHLGRESSFLVQHVPSSNAEQFRRPFSLLLRRTPSLRCPSHHNTHILWQTICTAVVLQGQVLAHTLRADPVLALHRHVAIVRLAAYCGLSGQQNKPEVPAPRGGRESSRIGVTNLKSCLKWQIGQATSY